MLVCLFVTDTTIAELIKEVTDSNSFLDTLQLQQELMLCVDTDKVQPFIEDCIAHKEPLVKVRQVPYLKKLFLKIKLLIVLLYSLL